MDDDGDPQDEAAPLRRGAREGPAPDASYTYNYPTQTDPLLHRRTREIQMLTFRRQLQSAALRPERTAPSLWLSFERVRHRIIVRTVAGGATYVAHKIDAAKPHDTLGTIAGNDSVVVVCASPEAAADLTARLTGILSPVGGP